jgi:hypothetical protein
VSRALFGSRVRATEVISVKAYPGFDLVEYLSRLSNARHVRR